ncbi:hypothetical protein DJ66_0099 [Candidatus Liberibacter solanacearum]|uniref:Uncharacterized protein n=1 Tax=Candidatus Liberibacter solanacearum TaxID=556287 RepID=A0A0F4VP89_9HYPH|nr:hypothetical protein DJ66_0099 [Candidatus Liberibacter solanacearum]
MEKKKAKMQFYLNYLNNLKCPLPQNGVKNNLQRSNPKSENS